MAINTRKVIEGAKVTLVGLLAAATIAGCKPATPSTSPTTTTPTYTTAPTTVPTTIPTTIPVEKHGDLAATEIKSDSDNVVMYISNVGEGPSSDYKVTLSIKDSTGKFSDYKTIEGTSIGAGKTVEQKVSLDELVKALSSNTKNRPGRYSVGAQIQPSDTEFDSPANNSTTATVGIARSPIKEATYDGKKVYTAANQDEIIQMLYDGPGKAFIDAGLDKGKVKISVLTREEAKVEWEKTIGKLFTQPLREIAFVRGTSTSQEIIVSEGTIYQVLPGLFRELSGAFYGQKNATGLVAGKAVGANEFAVTLGELYGYTWYAEHNIQLQNNVSYDIGELGVENFLKNPATKDFRAMWALWPEGASSGDVFKQYMDYIGKPDPTALTLEIFQKADQVDSATVVSKALWNVMVSKGDSSSSAKAAQDGVIFPVYPIK
jgi:hypothetical protein